MRDIPAFLKQLICARSSLHEAVPTRSKLSRFDPSVECPSDVQATLYSWPLLEREVRLRCLARAKVRMSNACSGPGLSPDTAWQRPFPGLNGAIRAIWTVPWQGRNLEDCPETLRFRVAPEDRGAMPRQAGGLGRRPSRAPIHGPSTRGGCGFLLCHRRISFTGHGFESIEGSKTDTSSLP